MNLIKYDEGISVWDGLIHMDSRIPQNNCVISHGHIDHLGIHEHIIATKPTIEIYEQRMRETEKTELGFSDPYELDGVEIQLVPAGHILGSAQVYLTRNGESVLYSGDFKVRPSLTAEMIEYKKADNLIMEATYGDPKSLFPDRQAVFLELENDIRTCIDAGIVPVVIAYSLGKGQEVVKYLGDRGYDMLVHNTIFDINKIYERNGVDLKGYKKLRSLDDVDEKVIIIPPYSSGTIEFDKLSNKKVFLLSGWKAHRGVRKINVDKIYPISDHADFNELLDYVRAVDPSRVFITHGSETFCEYLKDAGYESHFIGGEI